jgi:hypothetical protein
MGENTASAMDGTLDGKKCTTVSEDALYERKGTYRNWL